MPYQSQEQAFDEIATASTEQAQGISQMSKAVVGDLVKVVGGNSKGVGSGENGGGLPRIKTVAHKALTLPRKKAAGRQLTARGQGSMKVARPEQIIPLDDGECKDFYLPSPG